MTGYSWRKPSRCGANKGCVELAADGSQIAVRDSKDPHGSPILRYSRTAFAEFVAFVKAVY